MWSQVLHPALAWVIHDDSWLHLRSQYHRFHHWSERGEDNRQYLFWFGFEYKNLSPRLVSPKWRRSNLDFFLVIWTKYCFKFIRWGVYNSKYRQILSCYSSNYNVNKVLSKVIRKKLFLSIKHFLIIIRYAFVAYNTVMLFSVIIFLNCL